MNTTPMKRILCACGLVFLACAVLAVLPACHPSGDGADTQPSTDPAADPATEPTTEPATEAPATEPETDAPAPDTEPVTEDTTPETVPEETEEPLIVPIGYPAAQAGAKTDTVLSVADFGAKGDGVTDDGPAVGAAVRAAVEQQAKLTFEAGKTYYIGSATNSTSVFKSPLAMSGASGVTVDGQGAILKVQPGLSYFVLNGCEDIRLCNLTFDMAVPVYMVGTVVDKKGNTVTMTTDIEPARDSYNFSGVNGFSIRANDGLQARPHAFMGQMTRVAEKTVTVEYPAGMTCKVGDKIFLPNPGIGHAYSEVVYIGGCSGALVCENVTIRSAPSFIMAIKGNNAEIYFENTDMMPDPDDGREIKMVSWRDGYHCKDNRLPIHWNECDAGVMFDDVFNVSNTLGYVTRVSGTNSVTACNYEFYSMGQRIAFDVRAGDVVDVYNINNGAYYGCATIRDTVSNADGTTTMYFEYGQDIIGIPEGAVVGNRSSCAPGSTITNSRFEGTFRFIRDIRIENTTFEMLAMWIMVEGDVEGPLPGNIDFVNCTFNKGVPQIDAMNRGTNQYFKKIGAAITDIGFWGCEMKGKVQSSAKANWTKADTWTEEELYTVRNARSEIVTAVEIKPAESDFIDGVTYDWAYHTMPVTGAQPVLVKNVEDESLRAVLENGDAFLGRVLKLDGETLTLDGLDPNVLPFLYKSGSRYRVTVNVLASADGTCTLTTEGVGSTETLTLNAGKPTLMTFNYDGSSACLGLSLTFTGGGTVYVGSVSVSAAFNKNPSTDQLKNGHTFVWTDDVRIGDGKPVKIADITDETARNAITSASSGFTTGVVLHVTKDFGGFSGLTDPDYYSAGRTYHISLDAYIASPMVPRDGTTVYLIALDSTPGNRVLAQGLFTGEGLYHFEMDWTVGSTGETGLTFFMNNVPAQYADVYIGDFTVEMARSYKPSVYDKRTDFAYPSVDELRAGWNFDFTEGNALDCESNTYASMSAMDEKIAAKLNALGFGDSVLYVTENFHLTSVNPIHPGGHRFTVVMDVYDVIGNLATSGARGVFVQLHMQGGQQNSAEVSYKVDVDPNDSRHLTLTFTSNPPGGTDDLYYYQLTNMEFIIGSVYVKID